MKIFIIGIILCVVAAGWFIAGYSVGQRSCVTKNVEIENGI